MATPRTASGLLGGRIKIQWCLKGARVPRDLRDVRPGWKTAASRPSWRAALIYPTTPPQKLPLDLLSADPPQFPGTNNSPGRAPTRARKAPLPRGNRPDTVDRAPRKSEAPSPPPDPLPVVSPPSAIGQRRAILPHPPSPARLPRSPLASPTRSRRMVTLWLAHCCAGLPLGSTEVSRPSNQTRAQPKRVSACNPPG